MSVCVCMSWKAIYIPSILMITVAISTLISVSVSVSTAALGFQVKVIQSDGSSSQDTQEEQTVSQDGGIDLHQAGGEVDEEYPGVDGWFLIQFVQIVSKDIGDGKHGQSGSEDKALHFRGFLCFGGLRRSGLCLRVPVSILTPECKKKILYLPNTLKKIKQQDRFFL